MIRLRAAMAALTLAFAPAASASAAAPADHAAALKMKDCRPREGVRARCGVYEVFEDRARAAGRKIPLNMIVLPKLGPNPAREPLFFLTGGPGEAATDALDMFLAPAWAAVRRDRDIVLVDQRGTGKSNPLTCAVTGTDPSMRALYAFEVAPATLTACRAELERRADLRLYTTPIAMDDLDEVRAALGYDKVAIYGASYGTRAAFVYLRQHPERVRSVLMRAVAPVDMKAVLPAARHAENAWQGLVEACAADPGCAAEHPDLRGDLAAVLQRLAEAPTVFETKDPITGEPTRVEITRDVFAGALPWLMMAPEPRALVPGLVGAAAAGDFKPFVAATLPMASGATRSWSLGMALSAICSEDTPQIDPRAIPVATAGTFLGEHRVRNQLAACALWPRGSVPADFAEPVGSDAPVLMISGELDPIDGLDLALAAERRLPNSLHLVIPGGTHHPQFPGCLMEIAVRFLDQASTAGLDGACLASLPGSPRT